MGCANKLLAEYRKNDDLSEEATCQLVEIRVPIEGANASVSVAFAGGLPTLVLHASSAELESLVNQLRMVSDL